MRVTPISRLRGRILRCADCSLLCRTSAVTTADSACPRCNAHALTFLSTGTPFSTHHHR